MYSRVSTSLSGAWVSPCLCAPIRAFRFARPCLRRQPSRISPIPRLVRRSAKPKFSPHHGQQEEKRRNCSLVLASQFLQAGRRTIGSAWVGSSCLLSMRWVKQYPLRPERPKLGYLGAAAPKPVFAYFCLAAKVGRARGRETSLGRHFQKENGGAEPIPLAGAPPKAPRARAQNLLPSPGETKKEPPALCSVGLTLKNGGNIILLC